MGKSKVYPDKLFNLCSNDGCTIRLSCERAFPSKEYPGAENVVFKQNGDATCDWFVIRGKLADVSSTLRSSGRKHNQHAPISDQTRLRERRRVAAASLGLKQPDLKTRRHIRMGFDINKGKDPEEVDR